MSTQYVIRKDEQKKTLHVSPETHKAVSQWAAKHNMTRVQATFLLLRTGMRQWYLFEKKSGSPVLAKEKMIEEIDELARQEYLEKGVSLTDEELEQAE